MKLSLLNKLVDIKEYQHIKISSGDVSNTKVTVETNIPMRITTNKMASDNRGDTFGRYIASSHLGFCSIGVNVEKNYIVVYNTKEYKVDFVDKIPGGKENSHYQIYMTLVE